MIRVDVDKKKLDVKLKGVSAALGDLRPVWRDVQDIFLDFMKVHFRTEGAYAGVKWAPLSPRYAEWKRRHYGRRGILRRDDELYGSLTRRTHRGHVFTSTQSYVELGTRIRYARAHHFGAPRRNLPRRIVIPRLTKVEAERIVDAILARVLEAARKGQRLGTR